MATLYKRKPKPGDVDLEILSPNRQVAVAGRLWTIREFGLLEGARFTDVGQAAVKHFDEGGNVSPDLIYLMAAASGRDVIEVAGLPAEHFDPLVQTFIKVNGELFRRTAEPPRSKKPGSTRRWAEVFATLVAHGHDAERVEHYTLRQVTLYYEFAMRRERHARAGHVVDTNLGMAGGSKAKSHVKSLSEDNE